MNVMRGVRAARLALRKIDCTWSTIIRASINANRSPPRRRTGVSRRLAPCVLGLTAAALGCAAQAPAWAGSPSGPQGRTWASIAKLPNWQGIWQLDFEHLGQRRGAAFGGAPPALTAKTKAYLASVEAKQKSGEYLAPQTANCLPPGMPMIMTQPYPIEFLFNPGKVVILAEAYEQERTIYTDGRKHPAADVLTPTFQGNSIGHWEGKTLVIDTVGVLPNTGPGPHTGAGITQGAAQGAVNTPGIPHDKAMHIIERIRKTDQNHLRITTTIIDPTVLAKPWTVTRHYVRIKGDLLEYECEEGNRDSAGPQGRPGERISGL
jgi:hypothetical protein